MVKCCAAVTDASLLKDSSLAGIRGVILWQQGRGEEATSACLHELLYGIIVAEYIQKAVKHELRYTAPQAKLYLRFPASWNNLAKNPSQLG